MASAWLVAPGALLLFGCGATGLNWVQEPEGGHADAFVAPAPPGEGSSVASAAASASPDELRAEAPRPRLRHVVSLGETLSDGPRGSAPAMASAPSNGPVVVNVINYGGPGYTGYAGTYSGYAGAVSVRGGGHGAAPRAQSFAPTHVGPTSSLPSAQPQLPDYGPPFPFHSAPGSPWERAR